MSRNERPEKLNETIANITVSEDFSEVIARIEILEAAVETLIQMEKRYKDQEKLE
jgi:hypothetical protein